MTDLNEGRWDDIPPIPETAKWEEKILVAAFANLKTQLDVAILVSDSLGKIALPLQLQHIKREIETAEKQL